MQANAIIVPSYCQINAILQPVPLAALPGIGDRYFTWLLLWCALLCLGEGLLCSVCVCEGMHLRKETKGAEWSEKARTHH